MRLASRTVLLLLATLLLLPVWVPSASAGTPSWLDRVNSYRSAAGLPPVVESSALSSAAGAHARYMAANKTVTHDEDPSRPGYSAAGAKAGQQSNVAQLSTANLSAPGPAAVDLWMAAPYHAAAVLEPRARSMGFGISGPYVALNVFGDLSRPAPPASTYPLVWPAQNSTIHSTVFQSESPDPRAGCPSGFSGTVGSPLVAWGRGSDGKDLSYSASRLVREDGYVVELCTGAKVSGRTPFVPRYPLSPGYRYTFTVVGKGAVPGGSVTRRSTFTVAPHPVTLSLSSEQYVAPERGFTVTASVTASYRPGNRSYVNGSVELQWRPRDSKSAWQPLSRRFAGDTKELSFWVRTPSRPEFRAVYVPAGKDRSSTQPAYGAPSYRPPGCEVKLLDLRPSGTRIGYGCVALTGTGRMQLQQLSGTSWSTVTSGSAPLEWSNATYNISRSFTSGTRMRMLVLSPTGEVLASKEGTVG